MPGASPPALQIVLGNPRTASWLPMQPRTPRSARSRISSRIASSSGSPSSEIKSPVKRARSARSSLAMSMTRPLRAGSETGSHADRSPGRCGNRPDRDGAPVRAGPVRSRDSDAVPRIRQTPQPQPGPRWPELPLLQATGGGWKNVLPESSTTANRASQSDASANDERNIQI